MQDSKDSAKTTISFRGLMQALGTLLISIILVCNTFVICYDVGSAMASARVWVTLSWVLGSVSLFCASLLIVWGVPIFMG